PDDSVTVSGSDALPLVPALGLVIVAAALAIIAASVRLRRIVAILVIVAAITGIVIIAAGSASVDSSFVHAVRESPAFAGQAVPDAHRALLWPALSIAGFVLAALCGVVVTWWAGWWAT